MGGSSLRPCRDGVFRAGLQVAEIVEVLPISIIYAIFIAVAKVLHMNRVSKSVIQLEDRRGRAVRILPVDFEGAWHHQFSRHFWITIRRLPFAAVVGIGHLIYAPIDFQNSISIGYRSALPVAGFVHIKTRQLGEIKGSCRGGNFDGIRLVIKFYFHGGAAIP